MGGVTSKIGRSAKRVFKNYNMENRTAKVFEQQQQVAMPAPKHKTTVDALKKAAEEHPEFAQELARKNENLHDRLKGLHVELVQKSSSEQGEAAGVPKRSLPFDRTTQTEGEFGFHESTTVPAGRVSLKQAMQFMSEHQINPTASSAQEISSKYKLQESDVKNILQYYKILNVVVPKGVMEKSKKHLDQYNLTLGSAEELPDPIKGPSSPKLGTTGSAKNT